MINRTISLFLIVFLSPVFLFISILILCFDGRPIFFWSKRVGINNTFFYMPKFRTMKKNSPDLPTHKLKNPQDYIIRFGSILRKMSLDELPQLYSVYKGDINFIGPRPALHNQTDLITKRTANKIHKIPPGITGWAQVNGRDEISIEKKVILDTYYLNNKSLNLKTKILLLTIIQLITPKGVRH